MTCESGGKPYAVELGGALVAYVAALFVSLTLLKSVTDPIIRQLRRLDELQRRIQFEALAISFMGTAFITFGYGFLQLAGFPPVSWFTVWPIMAVLWLAGLWFSQRRYAGGDGGGDE